MYASEERGFDGGKKVKGRKRHVVSDTMGNLLAVKVHAANIHDTVAGEIVFKAAYSKYPSIKGCGADAGYRKTFVTARLSANASTNINQVAKRANEIRSIYAADMIQVA